MDLHKKIGGVPMWGWGLAIVGGLVLGIYLRKKGQTASVATAGVPFATAPDLSQFGGAAGSGGTSGVTSAPSGLDPGLEELLGSSMSALVNSQQIASALADSSTRGALDLAGLTTSDAFNFASHVFNTGYPAPVVQQMPASGGSGAARPQSAPPIQPAPQPPNTYNTASGVYVSPEGQQIAPTIQYSTSGAGNPVTGPSIFAFK